VDVYNKGSINDDFIGNFCIPIESAMRVETIKGIVIPDRGSFGLQIMAQPSISGTLPQYTFDGPIRYSRHFSPTVGRLANLNNADAASLRIWSTWKMSLKGIEMFFQDHHQHWNVNYKAAQSIFQGPLSIGIRTTIQVAHRMLYARTTTNASGIITSADDFWSLFRAGDEIPKSPSRQAHGEGEGRIKPAVYTYIIGEDGIFRFSETGAAFFEDFASKHALHSCCAETVRYSGEFHPRPVYPDSSGWSSFTDDTPDHAVSWQLVIDNNSGTYSPASTLLSALQGLLMYNFPGLDVKVMDFQANEAELKQSTTACREYAITHRAVKTTAAPAGKEETLEHLASVKKPMYVSEESHIYESYIA